MNFEINIYETLIVPFIIPFSVCISPLPFTDFEIKKRNCPGSSEPYKNEYKRIINSLDRVLIDFGLESIVIPFSVSFQTF